jgi:hypothetical protein
VQVDLREMSRQERRTGHQTTASRSGKEFLQPRRPRLLERLEVNAPVETRSIVPRSVDMRKSPGPPWCGTPSQLSAWSPPLVSAALDSSRASVRLPADRRLPGASQRQPDVT